MVTPEEITVVAQPLVAAVIGHEGPVEPGYWLETAQRCIEVLDTYRANLRDAEKRLAHTVLMLENSDCGADCGKFLHGNCGSFGDNTCDYCDAIRDLRSLVGFRGEP